MSGGICFRNIRGGLLKISKDALFQMRRYVQDNQGKTEAGGVLLGRYILGTEDVVVDMVTVPMPGDRRSKFWFFRDTRCHQAIIDQRWALSGHRCNYLGGWHTHPETIPTPSKTDTMDWKRALLKNQFDSETLYFIIIGTQAVRAWEGDRHTCEIEALLSIQNQEG